MDVMFAGFVLEGGVHGFDGEFAVQVLDVAVVAGRTRLLFVLPMAGEAA